MDSRDDTSGSGAPPVGERIRRRREELGLAAKDLAARVGISASYMSLIERQGRVPSAEVAAALARELRDDVDLYLAWAGSKDYDDLGTQARRLDRLHYYATDPEARRRIVSGEDLDEDRSDERPALAARSRPPSIRDRVASYLGMPRDPRRARSTDDVPSFARESPAPLDRALVDEGPGGPPSWIAGTVAIPLHANGADPAEDPEPIEILELDRRALPPGSDDLFAYRPDVRAARRVRDLIHPGDLVVLTRRPGSLDRRSIHAIRHRGRVVLTRAAYKGGRLAMLPAPGDPSSFEWIALDDAAGSPERALARVVAGSVVATLRWWTTGGS